MTITDRIQSLEPGARVRLYELDARAIGADLLLFHGHAQAGPIFWQGQEYSPWPIVAEGFARTTQQQPTPTLRVSNIDGTISSLCILFGDLLDAKLTRRSTLAEYLDAANFPGGNPAADPDEQFQDEIWYIERKVSEDAESVVFELRSPADFGDAQLPSEQVVADMCNWIQRGGYRGPYCGYSGPPVADGDDNPTSDPALDSCSGLVRGCKLRFGQNNPLPYGGFPGAGRLRT
ncbi:phage minor tail protein L [Lysobacter enzymogenes]|uniref:phage minor tail protein L n=1 Tax=Lysobacter enzymogenes TaxID=69 RepID=UPI0019D15D29|nr:phage minor tail protein L [Lysobacter enzymogenes]MBN7139006.1 phage minor tail protein L [Lysobacter enzymogenes]